MLIDVRELILHPVRIPAAFNGLFGIRPSSGRLPYEGMANSMDGQNSVLSVVGPIATTARSVKLAVQAILSQSPHLYGESFRCLDNVLILPEPLLGHDSEEPHFCSEKEIDENSVISQ